MAVGTDAITVNLKETTAYLDKQQAIIVENSVEGFVHGMQQKIAETIEFNAFDFGKYDRQSVQELESVLNK